MLKQIFALTIGIGLMTGQGIAQTPEAAACAAEAASQFEPGFAEVGRSFGSIDPDRAIAACETALAGDPESSAVKAWLARALLRNGQLAEARPLLEEDGMEDNLLVQQLLGDVLTGGFGAIPDYERGFALLTSAAEAGFAPAQFSLGYLTTIGEGIEPDAAAGAAWYRRAAEQGEPLSQARLGNMYATGEGVAQDYGEARRWYEAAAAQDNAEALHGLGQLYQYGDGVEQDYAAAGELFARSAELGDSWAQNDLGFLYEMGLGVTRDAAMAARYYQLAADQDYPLAMANLGNLYLAGDGVTLDPERAVALYEAAHTAGEPAGTVGLAEAYLRGTGVEVDYAQARDFAVEAAEAENSWGYMLLGEIYGEGFGVARDFAYAASMFETAEALGEQGAAAQAELFRARNECASLAASPFEAGFETTGRMVAEIDGSAAVDVCETAMELGPTAETSTWLGRALVAAGAPEAAAGRFEAALAEGWNPAGPELAALLQYGSGIAPDPTRALSLFRTAANRGNPQGFFGLGEAYRQGLGVPADATRAAHWLRLAATAGHPDAASALAALTRQSAPTEGGLGRAGPLS